MDNPETQETLDTNNTLDEDKQNKKHYRKVKWWASQTSNTKLHIPLQTCPKIKFVIQIAFIYFALSMSNLWMMHWNINRHNHILFSYIITLLAWCNCVKNLLIKSQISHLVCMMCFWNNLHQLWSKQKDWRAK